MNDVDGGRVGVRGQAAATAVAGAAALLWLVGLVMAGYAGDLTGALSSVGVMGFAGVGWLVVRQRPANRLGWLLCAGALAMGVLGTGGEYARLALVREPGSLPAGEFVGWLADAMAMPTVGVFAGLLPQLFPSGRPFSARWRPTLWAAWGFVVLGTVGNAFYPQELESVPGLQNPYAVESARPLLTVLIVISAVLGVAGLVGGVTTLALRWRRAAGDERQQLKWFISGVVGLPVPLVLHDVVPAAGDLLFSVLFIVIPATLGVAILRYRLYDLDLVVRRAVAYAAVSAVVAAMYLVIVGVAELAIGGQVSLTEHVLAAVLAAAGFHPVRARVQRAVDHVFYGDRDRPYDIVARLSRRLEAAVAPETVLPGVVDTVAEALHLRYVSIELHDAGSWLLVAEHGHVQGPTVTFPMTYQAELIGRMHVCPRGPGDELDGADRALLADLARQAGLAAHAVRTTTALQRSRAELVTAREEERRRLRRDLHDGLGPTLAGVTLGLHAAQSQLHDAPAEAERLLAGIEGQVEEAVSSIRRLVYGLRPPALDEFGLVRAVQLQTTRLEGAFERLTISVDSPPEGLGRLPAAVEVAAYRIVTEALTNVVKHSGARTCGVRFTLNGSLELEVTDDGRGISDAQEAGVGLTAMRERAAELGGLLAVEPRPTGTRVWARLPSSEPS